MPVSSLAEIICNYGYRILDECIFLLVQCNSLLTAFLQGFITVFLSEVQDTKTHAVGLDFIQPWFKNSADNGFRILSNKLGFLDKVWAIPLSKSFIIIRQMLWICRPLAFSCCSWPFTKKFSGKRINTDNSWGCLNRYFLMQKRFIYAIISIVKAYVEVAWHLYRFSLHVLVMHGGKRH